MSDTRNIKEQKMLVTALTNRQFEAVKRLLASGIDINAPYNDQGWTALHAVVEQYAPELVVFLLQNHADPNKKDRAGITPLHLAVDIEADSASQKPPVGGVRIDPRVEITSLLLEHGADPNIRNARGETPLDWAKRWAHEKAISLFKSKGNQLSDQ